MNAAGDDDSFLQRFKRATIDRMGHPGVIRVDDQIFTAFLQSRACLSRGFLQSALFSIRRRSTPAHLAGLSSRRQEPWHFAKHAFTPVADIVWVV